MTNDDAPSARAEALWLVALAVWLLALIAVRPLTLPDEGRYVGVAFAMTQGDLLTPRLHGLPYFHKPPLMYWIDALAMRGLGANEFAARVAPALGAWLMGAAIYLDLRRRRGPRTARIALGVLATMPFFFVGGQFANLDMLVAGLVTVSIVLGARAAESEDPSLGRRWAAGAWAAAGCAVLAKGLIGVVLPALVLGPWLIWRRRWGRLARLLHPIAIAAGVAVAAPWFIAMHLRYPGFLDYFFVEQHFRRYMQTGFNNRQPFWFFVPVVLVLTLPWSLWLARLRQSTSRTRDDLVGLYGWWIFVVVGFFSLPASKLVGYVLPAAGPLAALLGLAVERGRAWRWLMPVTALGCIVAVVVLARHDGESHREAARWLRDRVGPTDTVAFVGSPFFDVPFYARLATPPAVVIDWDDPGISKSDDWRKELLDAARFDASAGRRVLARPDAAGRLACGTGTLWILAAPGKALPADWIGRAAERVRDRHTVVWQIPRTAPCP